MNKVILMGRLTRDPEVRYSQGERPTAVARYTLAVNRTFKRAGEPDADFINCVAFGRAAEFAEKINNIQIESSNIVFIIGGSYGLSDEIKNMARFHLSFSKMTFPHQLFRVILLEQIYRGYKILNNESYHK